MSSSNQKFKYSDMEECMRKITRPEHEKQFLATFQRQRGFPKPSAASRQLVNVQVRYLQIIDIVKGEEILLHEKVWKLPQGAVTLAMNDSSFKASLTRASLEKDCEFLGAFSVQQVCLCCSKQANSFMPVYSWRPKINSMKCSCLFFLQSTNLPFENKGDR